MKKKTDYTIELLLLILAIACLASCTPNSRARNWGGTETINLESGTRLVNVTWKGQDGTDMWLLTKQDTTVPTTYTFQERSNWGVMEGKVIIIEK